VSSGVDTAAGNAPRTLLEILRKSAEFLRARGCDSPRLESELLLAKALGVARLDIYLQFDRPLLEDELARCRELVQRRGTREPLAYILGEKEFRSLVFEVDRRVFVPRPETELLVEEALRHFEAGGVVNPKIADVGTGSGCIAVSLACARPDLTALATDVSEDALAVAERNAARHGVAGRIEFVKTEGLGAASAECALDAVLSNPPYILPEESPGLPAELSFEPQVALFAPGGDARGVFASLARAARAASKPGAALLFEIGERQAAIAAGAAKEAGYGSVKVLKDLSGHDRAVYAVAP
jgi:release factor glutamine methyltransferase